MANPATLLTIGLLALVLGGALFWPRHGLVVRWASMLRRTERVLLEDALKHLYDSEYHDRVANLNSIAGALGVPASRAGDLIERLEALEFVTSSGGPLELTEAGRSNALRVIRSHRLWERYFAEHSGLHHTEWHPAAERLEHKTTPAQADALSARLGHPRFDPHGDPIPTADGEIAPLRGQPLNGLDVGDHATIVHVEDEPPAIYAQLVASGLQPGMHLRVLETSSERIRVAFEGDEAVLAPVVAANVAVVRREEPAEPPPASDKLTTLAAGETGTVVDISRACQGPQRRRLLDLGLVPGTEVLAEFSAPSGDPVAYRIRGAAIALRREQADMVQVTRDVSGATSAGEGAA